MSAPVDSRPQTQVHFALKVTFFYSHPLVMIARFDTMFHFERTLRLFKICYTLKLTIND